MRGVDPGHLRMVNGVPDRRRQDSAPRMMTADAAERIKHEAWLQMCHDLEGEWRKR